MEKTKMFIKKYIRIGQYLNKLYQKYHISAYSAQAAYFALLSGIPGIMLAVIFAGTIVKVDFVRIGRIITEIAPTGLHDFVFKLVDEIFSQTSIPLVSITSIFLMWAASKGVRSIGSGIQTIYDDCRVPSFIKSVMSSFFYTVALIFVILLCVVVLVFATPLEGAIQSFLGERGAFILLILNLRNIIFFVVLTFLFMLAYKSLAKSNITFLQQLPGAAIAAGGWILFSFGYSIYIAYFSNYTYLYGSLGALMLFMLWLYMCMNILLVGALINKLRIESKIKK